jgi:hypothetical protein
LRVDTVTGAMTVVASGLDFAVGLLMPSNMSYALISEQGSGGRIRRISLTPPSTLQTITSGLQSVFFLHWTDSYEKRFLAPLRSPNNLVLSIDLNAPLKPTTVVSGVTFQPSAALPGTNGEIYITSDNNVVSRFGFVRISSLSPTTTVEDTAFR